MTQDASKIEQMRNDRAIRVWENEGGARGREAMDEQYGRRVETDRSWTIYNVFTGVPKIAGGGVLTGLSRLEATNGMLSLNRSWDQRRIDLTALATRNRAPGVANEEDRS